MISWQLPLFYALLVLARHAVAKLPSPLICEDTLNGEAPFDNNEVPCILGCVHPRYQATLSFLPGSYNETFITFCQAQCVKHDITPDQLGEAQDCQNACHFHQENPEIYGWCLYWCLRGEKNVVESTTCVPSVGYGAPVTTVIGDETVTVSFFTEPPAWSRWAKTETVYLPDLRSNLGETGPTSTASAAATTETDVSSDATTTDAFTSSDATTTDASTAGTTSSSSAASRTRAHLFTSQTTSSSTTTTGSQNPQEQNDAKATTTSDGESLDPFGSLFMILVLLLVAVS